MGSAVKRGEDTNRVCGERTAHVEESVKEVKKNIIYRTRTRVSTWWSDMLFI